MSRERGFSLVEVLVATSILVVAVVALAQLFGVAMRSNAAARRTTYATVLAQQKVEALRALTWGFDAQGLPISDTHTDTAGGPASSTGGTGLSPSPGTALSENTVGFVDYVDRFGDTLGGGASAPRGSVYTRRWSIQTRPADPDTLVIQVLVRRTVASGPADAGAAARRPEEAHLVTVRTRTR